MDKVNVIKQRNLGLAVGFTYAPDTKMLLTQVAGVCCSRDEDDDIVTVDAISLDVETGVRSELSFSDAIQLVMQRPDLEHVLGGKHPRLPVNVAMEKFAAWLVKYAPQNPADTLQCFVPNPATAHIMTAFVLPNTPTNRPIRLSIVEVGSYTVGMSVDDSGWEKDIQSIQDFVEQRLDTPNVILRQAMMSACTHALFETKSLTDVMNRLDKRGFKYFDGAETHHIAIRPAPVEEIH